MSHMICHKDYVSDLQLVSLGKFFSARNTKFTAIFTWTAVETVIMAWTRCQTFKIGTSTIGNASYVLAAFNNTFFFRSAETDFAVRVVSDTVPIGRGQKLGSIK